MGCLLSSILGTVILAAAPGLNTEVLQAHGVEFYTAVRRISQMLQQWVDHCCRWIGMDSGQRLRLWWLL